MAIDLIAQSRTDWRKFTQAEFGVDLAFEAPNLSTANVRGLATDHHMSIDPETGLPVNSKNSHCSVSEQLLLDASYPVRDALGEVSMVNHKVTFKDSTGVSKTRLIDESYPDETVGMLIFILGDYE